MDPSFSDNDTAIDKHVVCPIPNAFEKPTLTLFFTTTRNFAVIFCFCRRAFPLPGNRRPG